MKHGKKYNAIVAKLEANKVYSVNEACTLIKETNPSKFDATIGLSFNLNVDPRNAEQQVRGTLILPHGNGKTKKVLVITNKVEEAKAAGADLFGGKEMVEKIRIENWFDYDIIVATPDMMGELGKIGRLLGPKGLMPNPKTGTVTTDIEKTVKEIKAGKIEYRVDKDGNMHLPVAKVSFDAEKILENVQLCIDTINKVRPAAVKGTYIASLTLHTTMGPGLRLEVLK